MNAVELAGVSRSYPGSPPVRALGPTDLEIGTGRFVAVAGPSGSGKSTLLNLLGLLDRPSGGAVRIDGVETSGLSERDRTTLRGERIGFVFQAFHLLPYRTALDNVALAQVYRGTRRRAREAQAREALERVGLAHRVRALPGTMSGGEQQRVAIARAIVNRPALLLCDEPTGNLDSATSAAVLDLLAGLHADGTTIVMITHDGEMAARAERVLTIRDGVLTG